MGRSKCRNARNMKTQGNNSTIMVSNDSRVDEISDKEFKRIIIRLISEVKEGTNKQMNSKSIKRNS
jgi:hypothetical protein